MFYSQNGRIVRFTVIQPIFPVTRQPVGGPGGVGVGSGVGVAVSVGVGVNVGMGV